jgi:hypothetical protein
MKKKTFQATTIKEEFNQLDAVGIYGGSVPPAIIRQM